MGTAVARHRTRTKAQTEAEVIRVYELFVAGAEPVHIARELGISRATVYRRIDAGRKLRLDPLVDEYRHDASTRINEARRRVYEALNLRVPMAHPITGVVITDEAGEVVTRPWCSPADVGQLIGRLATLEDLEAKMRGGYAPQVVRHEVEDAFTRLMDELNATPAPQPTTTEA